MPLTRIFKQTVQAHIERDPAFREEFLNLFELIGHLQRAEGLHFELSLRK
jgi:hypothetical protein